MVHVTDGKWRLDTQVVCVPQIQAESGLAVSDSIMTIIRATDDIYGVSNPYASIISCPSMCRGQWWYNAISCGCSVFGQVQNGFKSFWTFWMDLIAYVTRKCNLKYVIWDVLTQSGHLHYTWQLRWVNSPNGSQNWPLPWFNGRFEKRYKKHFANRSLKIERCTSYLLAWQCIKTHH